MVVAGKYELEHKHCGGGPVENGRVTQREVQDTSIVTSK